MSSQRCHASVTAIQRKHRIFAQFRCRAVVNDADSIPVAIVAAWCCDAGNAAMIRGLEGRLGVRLLARTARSVAPTDAGAELLARVRR